MAKKVKITTDNIVTANNKSLSTIDQLINESTGVFEDKDTHYTAVPGTAAISTNNVAITITENDLESGRVTLSGDGNTTVTRDSSGKIIISSTGSDDDVVTYTQGTGIKISNNQISLQDTLTAGTFGPTADVTTGSTEQTIIIPQLTIDNTGRVTAVSERSLKVKGADTNTIYTGNSPVSVNNVDHTISLSTIPVSLGGTGETTLTNVTVGGASNAASVSGHTVATDVPSDAKFTDTHYQATPSVSTTNNVATLSISENSLVSGSVTLKGGDNISLTGGTGTVTINANNWTTKYMGYNEDTISCTYSGTSTTPNTTTITTALSVSETMPSSGGACPAYTGDRASRGVVLTAAGWQINPYKVNAQLIGTDDQTSTTIHFTETGTSTNIWSMNDAVESGIYYTHGLSSTTKVEYNSSSSLTRTQIQQRFGGWPVDASTYGFLQVINNSLDNSKNGGNSAMGGRGKTHVYVDGSLRVTSTTAPCPRNAVHQFWWPPDYSVVYHRRWIAPTISGTTITANGTWSDWELIGGTTIVQKAQSALTTANIPKDPNITVASTTTNLNSMTTPGFYSYSSVALTNGPVTSKVTASLRVKTEGSYTTQILHVLGSGATGSTYYYRESSSSGSFSSSTWTRMITTILM